MTRWLWDTYVELSLGKLLKGLGAINFQQVVLLLAFVAVVMFVLHWAVHRFGSKALVDEWDAGLRRPSKRADAGLAKAAIKEGVASHSLRDVLIGCAFVCALALIAWL